MKFWCHDQRELKALLAAEEVAHLRDNTIYAMEKSSLLTRVRNAEGREREASRVAAVRANLLTDIEVACQRAQRAGSHIAITEIFDVLDRRP